ncbi:YecA family protein [Methylophilus sp.]|uniref:YecA family protein n=1 Tax=Methylophilus sp. TaxID=29541 RepID=UPI0011D86685|nr:SEC-C domain-containing protein [Methylophilus sp.]TXI44189.1 MAG: hypothetical protein E6Q52_10020 [Methylophilus sp.]
MNIKIGRNQLCPCGSGEKYKRCHGSLSTPTPPKLSPEKVKAIIDAREAYLKTYAAQKLQRQKQQGLGREIISTEASGTRFVAVNNKIAYGKNWKTFTDFLFDYIRDIVGKEWGQNEIDNKSDEERHTLISWYQKLCLLQQSYSEEPGKIYSMPLVGVVSAYLGLSYDLYCLEHNGAMQQALLERLKNPDENFYGVRYEITVAAIMIRAGFELEFEDETDRRTSHCEFTATSSKTGKSFSVECKRLESSQDDGIVNLKALGKRFSGALKKHADHLRIVFIDLNFPYDPKVNFEYPKAMDLAIDHIRKFEFNTANGGNLPPAFVFLTNAPFTHHLYDEGIAYAVITDGFKIPEYKTNKPYHSLREAINDREKFSDIHHLLESIEKYKTIPTTFDGELPEFSLDPELQKNRLIIGNKYLVPDDSGKDVEAVLIQGVVMEHTSEAFCYYQTQKGSKILAKCPLSTEEIVAYRRSPETFFGVIDGHRKEAHTALELYDFLYEVYKKTSKEILLNFFKDSPDYLELSQLSQDNLASIYAERCAYSAFSQNEKINK